MLVQLPSGNWIDPETVVAVVAFGRAECGNPDRVVVSMSNGAHECICVESYEDAETMRDQIALQVNPSATGPDRATER